MWFWYSAVKAAGQLSFCGFFSLVLEDYEKAQDKKILSASPLLETFSTPYKDQSSVTLQWSSSCDFQVE